VEPAAEAVAGVVVANERLRDRFGVMWHPAPTPDILRSSRLLKE
jgi:hypothetical protein